MAEITRGSDNNLHIISGYGIPTSYNSLTGKPILNVSALPTTGTQSDIYKLGNELWVWNGTSWEKLSGDVSVTVDGVQSVTVMGGGENIPLTQFISEGDFNNFLIDPSGMTPGVRYVTDSSGVNPSSGSAFLVYQVGDQYVQGDLIRNNANLEIVQVMADYTATGWNEDLWAGNIHYLGNYVRNGNSINLSPGSQIQNEIDGIGKYLTSNATVNLGAEVSGLRLGGFMGQDLRVALSTATGTTYTGLKVDDNSTQLIIAGHGTAELSGITEIINNRSVTFKDCIISGTVSTIRNSCIIFDNCQFSGNINLTILDGCDILITSSCTMTGGGAGSAITLLDSTSASASSWVTNQSSITISLNGYQGSIRNDNLHSQDTYLRRVDYTSIPTDIAHKIKFERTPDPTDTTWTIAHTLNSVELVVQCWVIDGTITNFYPDITLDTTSIKLEWANGALSSGSTIRVLVIY